MYVEKRKYYGKTKYWLSHSFREGGKVHKIRKLLGSNLSSEVLRERTEKAKQLILDEINKYKIIKDPLQLIVLERIYISSLNTLSNLFMTIPLSSHWNIQIS